ncbi:hypothetical protein PG987_002369 [Apiospora arundinis]
MISQNPPHGSPVVPYLLSRDPQATELQFAHVAQAHDAADLEVRLAHACRVRRLVGTQHSAQELLIDGEAAGLVGPSARDATLERGDEVTGNAEPEVDGLSGGEVFRPFESEQYSLEVALEHADHGILAARHVIGGPPEQQDCEDSYGGLECS